MSDYLVVGLPMLAGSLTGTAIVWTALKRPRFLVLASVLAGGGLGTAIGASAPDGWAAAAAFLTGVLIGAWCAGNWWRYGGGDDGGDEGEPGPEPPWWPEFEAQFQDYAHRPKVGSR